jgi:nitroreductase
MVLILKSIKVIIMRFIDLVKKRSSVRNFIEMPVENEKIDYILECARFSPSWMNKQCWRFIIVKNTNKIKEIANCSVINRWIRKAPIILLACADPLQSGKKNNINYYVVDTSIAMEHIILACTELGLGSCWIGGFKENKIKEILEIPPRIKVIALTPIGYPTDEIGVVEKSKKIITRRTTRKSLREIVHYEKW